MKELFEEVSIELIVFESQDVIVTSGDMDDNEWD